MTRREEEPIPLSEKHTLRLRHAAQFLDVSPDYLARLAKLHEIPVVRFGKSRALWFRRCDLEELALRLTGESEDA